MVSNKERTLYADSLFVVRFYDGFDNIWTDISKPVSREKAERIWDKMTNNGQKNTRFDDIDYYHIFPANTIMRFSLEGEKLRKKYER